MPRRAVGRVQRAQQEEQLLFLLASQGWGSATSPALLRVILQQLLLGGAGGCGVPAGNAGDFWCEVMPKMKLHR